MLLYCSFDNCSFSFTFRKQRVIERKLHHASVHHCKGLASFTILPSANLFFIKVVEEPCTFMIGHIIYTIDKVGLM